MSKASQAADLLASLIPCPNCQPIKNGERQELSTGYGDTDEDIYLFCPHCDFGTDCSIEHACGVIARMQPWRFRP